MVADQISEWLENYAVDANKDTFIVDMTGGVDTAVVAALCAQTKLSTVLVQFSYGMRPYSHTRVSELVERLQSLAPNRVSFFNFDLQNSFQDLLRQSFSAKRTDDATEALSRRALKSNIKTPVLDYLAKVYNGLIVGGHNKDEDYFLRTFHRRGSGTADLQPLGWLHKSQIYGIASFLELPKDFLVVDSTVNSFGGDPTGLLSPEDDVVLTSEDVEWGRKECEKWAQDCGHSFEQYISFDKRKFFQKRSGTIEFPHNYDEIQRKKMKKMIELEYSTRHKHFSFIPRARFTT